MFYHHAFVVDRRVFDVLVAAWRDARAGGSDRALEQTLERASSERARRARMTHATVPEGDANRLAQACARAFEEQLRIALAEPRPIEDVMALERYAARFEHMVELGAPAFLLDAIAGSIVDVVRGWRAASDVGIAPADRASEPARDLRWLPREVIELAQVIGSDEIGLQTEVDALSIVADFQRAHPDAGSFWDVHGSGGPDDPVERYPHPIWEATLLPIRLRVGEALVRLGVSCGPLGVADASSATVLSCSAEQGSASFRARVSDAIGRGHAVVEWLELQT